MIFIERDRYIHPEDWVNVADFFRESYPGKFPGHLKIRDPIYLHRSGVIYNGNSGNVIRIMTKRFRLENGRIKQYEAVNIWQRPISYPRLYLWAFGKNRPENWRHKIVKHINGNFLDNRLENLRW